ncbi:MAG: lysylphosphatidylglycerol synthase transmembrane domain-containing protein [Candidatus Bathyarchaeia archaeon]
MTQEKPKVTKRYVLFLLIGLSIFILYLYLSRTNIPKMITIIQSTDPFYYSLAVIAFLLNILCYSLAWQYFLRPLSVNVSFRKTFMFTWVGAFIDILIPAESVSGEISKAYFMSKETGGKTGKVIASIVSHRIISMIITISSLILSSLSFFVLKYELPSFILNWIIFVAVGTAVTLFFLFLFSVKEKWAQKIIDLTLRFFEFISRGHWHLAGLRSKAQKTLKTFHQAIEVLGTHPRSLAQPVAFSIASWFFSILIPFLVFFSLLGHPIHLGVVIIVHSVSWAVRLIPFGIPAEIGLTESFMAFLYGTLLGVPPHVSSAGAILISALTVGLKLIVGFVALQWVGIKPQVGSSR